MAERRTLGQILVSVGRITEEDVATALAYQRDRGGYFGEALVACGLATPEELEWCLASQFDLPYVFPDADAIDPDVAALVSPEWALSNLTLPIMRTADTLKVVVDSPLKSEPIEELRARTELEVDLALASPSAIRDLIRQVFARASVVEDQIRAPLRLGAALDAVLEAESPRFGVSIRPGRPAIWWEERNAVRRRPLAGPWLEELDAAITPSISEMTDGVPTGRYEAELRRAGAVVPLVARFLSGDAGTEVLFQPLSAVDERDDGLPSPPAGLVTEMRLLARSGRARVVVTADPPSEARALLPHLPRLLLDPAWRSVHLESGPEESAESPPGSGAPLPFTVSLSGDAASWGGEIEALRPFQFDAVTVDLPLDEADWMDAALRLAGVAFLFGGSPAPTDLEAARVSGVRWGLDVSHDEHGDPAWSLEPLEPPSDRPE